MQVTVSLQEAMSYLPMIGVAFAFIITGLFVIFFPKRKKQKPATNVPKVQPVPKKNVATIKEKYDKILTELLEKWTHKELTDRLAYQKLSGVVRDFVYETTGIKVQNYTLEEIKGARMPRLYELISECYVPEFAWGSSAPGDFKETINKARKVIEEWS